MNFYGFLQKRWTIIALIIIISLGIGLRVSDFHWNYLRNIDSYTFYRWMDDISVNGKLPLHDNLTYAPIGEERQAQIYPYQHLGAYSYNFVHLFFPNMQMWQWLIWFTPILASLAAIPMYFIGKMLYNRKAGVLAAFFIVFEVSNISRSLGGDPDNDAIVILMPLIVMAAFIYTYKYIDKIKSFTPKFFLYTAVVGALLGLWGHTWAGFWYVAWMMFGFLFLKLILSVAKLRSLKLIAKENKHLIAAYVLFLVFLALTVVPYFGWGKLTTAITGPIDFQSIKSEEGIQHPNVYVSVAELQQSGGIKEILQRTSALNGPWLLLSPFFLMLYAIIYLVYSSVIYITRKRGKQHFDTVILLLIWFVFPLLATVIAVRFSILFSAPMAIGSGIILAKILDMALKKEKFEE